LELRAIKEGRKAIRSSYKDKKEDTRAGASRYANMHAQPSVDFSQSEAVEGSREIIY
jgi:hypothetical protein